MRITIVGYMCSGKSTIGRKLANIINYRFIDLDECIEAKYHISIWDFFRKYDNIAFRRIERETLLELISGEDIVLATGGGTPCYYDNMAIINDNSHSFYLQVPYGKLIHRILESKKKRPILSKISGADLNIFIDEHLKERAVFYCLANHIIDCEHKEVDVIMNEILDRLKII